MKKRILLIMIFVLLNIIFFSGCSKQNNSVKTNEYIEYSKGKIYIRTKKEIPSVQNLEENDILVLDGRNNKDPNMKIYNSSSINDIIIINEVLNKLLEYEKENPSGWDRSIESMRTEWIVHNLAFYSKKNIERSRDVDLNNKDEKKYKNLINVIFKNENNK